MMLFGLLVRLPDTWCNVGYKGTQPPIDAFPAIPILKGWRSGEPVNCLMDEQGNPMALSLEMPIPDDTASPEAMSEAEPCLWSSEISSPS